MVTECQGEENLHPVSRSRGRAWRAGTTEQNREEITIYIGRGSAYIPLMSRTGANAQQTSLETLQKGNWSLVWELLVLIPGNTASAQFHSGL